MVRLLAILLILPLQAFAADLGDTLRAQTRYYGVGLQKDGNYWSIDGIFGQKDGQIAYPSLVCHGIWTLKDETHDRITFNEQILEGEDNCVILGTVTLTPLSDDLILYEWSEFPPLVDARAVLSPATDNKLSYIDQLRLTLNTVAHDYLLPELRD